MNWPKNVVPAVCVGLSGCGGQRKIADQIHGFPIQGVARVEDPAGRADSTSAASRPFLPGTAKGCIRSKIRPKCCVLIPARP